MRAWIMAGLLLAAGCGSDAKPPPDTTRLTSAKAIAAADSWILLHDSGGQTTNGIQRACLEVLYMTLTQAQLDMVFDLTKTPPTDFGVPWQAKVDDCYKG